MTAETARCQSNGAVALCELSRVLSLLPATAHPPYLAPAAHRRHAAGARRGACRHCQRALALAARGATRRLPARVVRPLAIRAQLAGHLSPPSLQPARRLHPALRSAQRPPPLVAPLAARIHEPARYRPCVRAPS